VGVRVVVLRARDLNWSFDDRPPSWRTKSAIKDYGRTVNVDPTPCYSHDRDLVRVEAKHVDEAFPIGVPVTVHVSRWEETRSHERLGVAGVELLRRQER
jgi:hypothetical protein